MTEKDASPIPTDRTNQTAFVDKGGKFELPQLPDQDDEIDTEEAIPLKETDTREMPRVEPEDSFPRFYGDYVDDRNERVFTQATHGKGNKAKTS